MPIKKTNNNSNIFLDRDDFKASPFVVDLRQKNNNLNQKTEPHRKENLEKTFIDFFEKDKQEKVEKKVEKVKKIKPEKIEVKKTEKPKKPAKPRIQYLKIFLKLLAFFNIFKLASWVLILIGKGFYKFCYGLGWATALPFRAVLHFFVVMKKISLKILHPDLIEKVRQFSVFSKKQHNNESWLKYKLEKFSGKGLQLTQVFSRLLARQNGKSKEIEKLVKAKKNLVLNVVEKTGLKKEKSPRFKLHPIASFVLVVMLIVLPFKFISYFKSLDDLKGKVMAATTDAISQLFSAGQSAKNLDFKNAAQDFNQAGTNFLLAQGQVSEINDLLLKIASFAPNKNIRLAGSSKHVLAAGQSASDMGANLSSAVAALLEGKEQGGDMIKKLNDFTDYGQAAVNNAHVLNQEVGQVNFQDLPDEYQAKFIEMKDKGVFLEKSLAEFIDIVNELKIFLGVEQDKRYLMIFQNNSELRATGGFFGSYALIDFSKGKIKNIETPAGGSYDTEAGLKERIVAPKPLQMLNPLWHFWDANWWPDWPTTAKKLMWFYEKSDGPTVDGVISLTPTVIESMLKVTGPIDMTEKYGVVIDANNFWEVTQTFAEQKPDKTKEPKKIVGDLLNKIIEELPKRFNRQTLFGMINSFEQNLSEKQILLYFKDDNLEQAVQKYGWDGSIKQTKWDYLSVINTNIGGGKSDRKMVEKIYQTTEIQPDGTIIDQVQISRTHTGVKNEPFSGIRNVDWQRIYVPAGSELLDARGFGSPSEVYFGQPDQTWKNDSDLAHEEADAKTDVNSGTKIYQENGKTVFANWIMTDPGETSDVFIRYKLPFKFSQIEQQNNDNWWNKVLVMVGAEKKPLTTFGLLVQKQPGAMPSQFVGQLKTDSDQTKHKMIWSYPDTDNSFNTTDTGWSIKDSLNVDKYWAVVME